MPIQAALSHAVVLREPAFARKEKFLTEPKAAETNFLEDIMLAPTLASGSSVTSYSTAKTSGGKR
jgi:hypothetical protein